MILSFTRDAAKLFNLTKTLKLAHSERYLDSQMLDDWVLGILFSSKKSTGVYLIHRHSLLALFVVAAEPDLNLCMNLFFEQLLKVLINAGFTDKKYAEYFDRLFYELMSVRHDNSAISKEIGDLKYHFDWFNEEAYKNKQKTHSIDFVNLLNNKVRKKFAFKRPIEIFCGLVEQHYNDPILISDKHPSYTEHDEVTFH